MIGKLIDLVAELELFYDVLHVLRESIQIQDEISFQLLLVGTGLQI